MIQIDARLRAIAAFVPAGDVLADIGGDHAYLAAALVQEGRCPRAIVGDLSAGACLAARRTAARCQCIDRIDVRQGDGLSVLLPDEADTVAIAGMGGALMAQILAAAPHILCTVGTLVLQPMNAADALRRWLYENDWHIADETLVRAGGRLYGVQQCRMRHFYSLVKSSLQGVTRCSMRISWRILQGSRVRQRGWGGARRHGRARRIVQRYRALQRCGHCSHYLALLSARTHNMPLPPHSRERAYV